MTMTDSTEIAFRALSIREAAFNMAYQRNPTGFLDDLIAEARKIESFLVEKLPNPEKS